MTNRCQGESRNRIGIRNLVPQIHPASLPCDIAFPRIFPLEPSIPLEQFQAKRRIAFLAVQAGGEGIVGSSPMAVLSGVAGQMPRKRAALPTQVVFCK
jgi:hypothetical protein